jgi:hypothetical protein
MSSGSSFIIACNICFGRMKAHVNVEDERVMDAGKK